MFDSLALAELEEMLGYERYVLRKCVNLDGNTLGLDYPLQIVFYDDNPVIDLVIGMECSLSGEDVAAAIQELSPLLLCAGYKLLDMVFEWTLSENGIRGQNGRITFKKKRDEIQKLTVNFPSILDSEPNLREKFIGLYDSLAEIRNAITHRKWGEGRNGNLHFNFERQDTTTPTRCTTVIPFRDVLRFCEVLSDLADALLSPSGVSPRTVSVMTSKLNELASLHNKGQTSVVVPRLFYVTRKTSQTPPFAVNVENIRKRVSEQASGSPFEIDLRIEVMAGEVKQIWQIPAQFVPTEDFVLNEEWERFEIP